MGPDFLNLCSRILQGSAPSYRRKRWLALYQSHRAIPGFAAQHRGVSFVRGLNRRVMKRFIWVNDGSCANCIEWMAEKEYGLCYCAPPKKTTQAYMVRAISVLALYTAVWLIGCAASQPIEPSPNGKALLGKNKQELVACAGNPLQEMKTAEGTVLSYYKEAPMFEESFASSKTSRSGAHHGCWAHLLMADDHVVGVEYRSVPRSLDATDHCEEIFHTCVQ
jgi:hypothetical protein